ncbi:MAG: hypothetical protein AVDCRST_MAG43-1368, partial [uncultured Thermomicrobiales bacterium]
ARVSASSSSGRGCSTRSTSTSCPCSWAAASGSSMTLGYRHGSWNSRAESRSPESPISGSGSRAGATPP